MTVSEHTDNWQAVIEASAPYLPAYLYGRRPKDLQLREPQFQATLAVFRAYQEKQITKPLVVLPTGVGKTKFAGGMSGRVNRTIFAVPREELLTQTVEMYRQMYPDDKVGVVAGALSQSSNEYRFVVAMLPTLYERVAKKGANRIDIGDVDLFVIDEAHHATARTWRATAEAVPARIRLGMSATPERSDGAPLTHLFDEIVYQMSLRDAIAQRYLVPPMVTRVRTSISLARVRATSGDFVASQLGRAVNIPARNELIVKTYLERGRDARTNRYRKAITFAVDIAHAQDLADTFNAHGIRTQAVWGDDKDRKRKLAAHAAGDLDNITNAAVLCLDDQTELLTRRGWVGKDDIGPEDLVANWDNGVITFEPPLEIVRRPRQDWERMVVLETPGRSVRVTEGHRMLHRCYNGVWHKSAARDLVGKDVEIPVTGLAEPEPLMIATPPASALTAARRVQSISSRLRTQGWPDAESRTEAARRIERRDALQYRHPDQLTLDECRLIGFWMGDGTRGTPGGGVEYILYQSERYPRIIEWVDGLLGRLSLHNVRKTRPAPSGDNTMPYVKWSLPRGTGFGDQARQGVFALEPYLDKDGSHLLWGLNAEQFGALIEGLWYADGNHGQAEVVPDGKRLHATRKGLFDLLQAIGTSRGFHARIRQDFAGNDRHQPRWNLHISSRQAHSINTSKNPDNGFRFEAIWKPEEVWCVKTRTRNLVTRRRGTVTVMGNTEGYDDPTIGANILARPTASRSLYVQMLGRSLRLHPGKMDSAVFDFVDNTGKHDLMTAWKFLGDLERVNPKTGKRREASERDIDPEMIFENYAEMGGRLPLFSFLEQVDLLKLPPEVMPRQVGTYGWHVEPPTEKQLLTLKEHGHDVDKTDWTRGMAQAVIESLPPSNKQVVLLLAHGYDIFTRRWTRAEVDKALADARADGVTANWDRVKGLVPGYRTAFA